MATGYYAAFSEVPYNDNKFVVIVQTKRLLEKKTEIICGASFSFDGNSYGVGMRSYAGKASRA